MNTIAAAPDDLRNQSDDDLFALVPLDADWQDVERMTTPVHTARRLRTNEPMRYETLRRALECGAAITTLATSHKVGIHTLYAIIDAEFGGRDKYHAGLAGKFKAASNMGVDKVMELLPDEKDLMKVGIVTGIMADKALALSGSPQLVIEHRHTSDDGVRKLTEMIEAARERIAQGRVVEEPAGERLAA